MGRPARTPRRRSDDIADWCGCSPTLLEAVLWALDRSEWRTTGPLVTRANHIEPRVVSYNQGWKWDCRTVNHTSTSVGYKPYRHFFSGPTWNTVNELLYENSCNSTRPTRGAPFSTMNAPVCWPESAQIH